MLEYSFYKQFNHLNQVINLKTYLSDEVNEIVFNENSFSSIIAPEELWTKQEDLILNSTFLARKFLHFGKKSDLNEIDFKRSLVNLKICFPKIKENILKHFDYSKNAGLFFGSEIEYFQKNVFKKLHEYLQSNNNIHLYISFLNIFIMLERSLGNVIYSFNTGESCHIPFLLKDLVCSENLIAVLGESLCHLLAIFFYSPRSLNLRNLIWHGFLQPNELNEDYIFFLIAIITSINGILSTEIFTQRIASLKERPQINLNENLKRNFKNSQIIENFSQKFTKECSFIFQNSKLIDNKEIWIKSFSENETSFDIIILLLPQIEHLLRKLYSLYNLDSQCQIAKIDEYYLTIDDLLKFKNTKSCTNNKLIDQLDPQLILFIHELFMYEDGPRLRDRASHGELNQKAMARYYADCIQFLSVLLASACLNLNQNENLQRLYLFKSKIYSEFESIHHPISILKKTVYTTVDLSMEFYIDYFKSNFFQPNADLDYFKDDFEKIKTLCIENFGFDILSNNSLESHWKITDFFKFVYRYDLDKDSQSFKSNESQIIRILIKLCNLIYNILTVISEFLKQAVQTKSESLRQRKRENIDSFFKNVSCFEMFFKLSLYCFIYFIDKFIIQKKIEKIGDLHVGNSVGFAKVMKFFKNYLKVIENLSSKTGSNKWAECKNLIIDRKENLFSNFFEFLIMSK
jgi:hypothetical protein